MAPYVREVYRTLTVYVPNPYCILTVHVPKMYRTLTVYIREVYHILTIYVLDVYHIPIVYTPDMHHILTVYVLKCAVCFHSWVYKCVLKGIQLIQVRGLELASCLRSCTVIWHALGKALATSQLRWWNNDEYLRAACKNTIRGTFEASDLRCRNKSLLPIVCQMPSARSSLSGAGTVRLLQYILHRTGHAHFSVWKACHATDVLLKSQVLGFSDVINGKKRTYNSKMVWWGSTTGTVRVYEKVRDSISHRCIPHRQMLSRLKLSIHAWIMPTPHKSRNKVMRSNQP